VDWSALASLTRLDLANNQLSHTVPSAWPAGMVGTTASSAVWLSGNALLCGPLPGRWANTSIVVVTGTLLNQACPSPPPSPPSPPPPPPTAGSALWSLRAATTSAWSAALDRWDAVSDPCGMLPWQRVTCNATTGLPSAVDLSYLDMTFTLPPAWAFVTSLRDVRMGPGNALQGTLPAEWSALSALTRLDLSYGQLAGTLPQEWSALGALRLLNLQSNTLHSSVPAPWSSGMAAMSTMVLSDNAALCGPLPGGQGVAGLLGAWWTRVWACV
jgi:hypothetical protein